jgi:preprotein translocase SecE subunit
VARNRQKAKQRKAKADAAAAKSGAPANGAPDPVGAPPSDEGTVKAAASVEATEEIKRTAKLKPEPAKSQPKAAKDKPVKEKGRLRTFLRSSWAELRRVQWPDRKQMSTMTTIVIGFVILAGAYLGAIDFVANKIVDFLVF